MKTKPTETDREAGRVFVPLAAMRGADAGSAML